MTNLQDREQALQEKYDLQVLPSGELGTSNNKGFQMATCNPLADQWITCYKAPDPSITDNDKRLPILDIGAAWGINSFFAARAGARVVALDMSEEHLSYIRERWELLKDDDDYIEGSVTCTHSMLPELKLDNDISSQLYSAVLVSEVIHFLEGSQLAQAFARFHQLLAPGGYLYLTCCAVGLLGVRNNPGEKEAYMKKKASGDRWPGEVRRDEEILKTEDRTLTPRKSSYTFIHFFDTDQIRTLAQESGFQVISCDYGNHPGYPTFVQQSGVTDFNVQLVARK